MGQEYYFPVPGKESDEPIVIYLHRHFASFFRQMLVGFFFTILPWVFWYIYNQYYDITTTNLQQFMVIILFAIYYLILACYIFIEWMVYYYGILIVTTKTLIDIDQKTIFSRNISHVHLMQIEDIQSEIKGLLPTIFAYGNVLIQTAGSEEHTIIKDIPNPQQVSALILKLHQEVLESANISAYFDKRKGEDKEPEI